MKWVGVLVKELIRGIENSTRDWLVHCLSGCAFGVFALFCGEWVEADFGITIGNAIKGVGIAIICVCLIWVFSRVMIRVVIDLRPLVPEGSPAMAKPKLPSRRTSKPRQGQEGP